MRTVEVPPGAAASSSVVTCFAGLPRFRLPVASTFVAVLGADLVAVSLVEAFVVVFAVLTGVDFPLVKTFAVFFAVLTGVDFPLVEALVERGASATASEVLLGLEDDAVVSMIFFCLFVAVVLGPSASAPALRFPGAMILAGLVDVASKRCECVSINSISDQIQRNSGYRAHGANGHKLAALVSFPPSFPLLILLLPNEILLKPSVATQHLTVKVFASFWSRQPSGLRSAQKAMEALQ